MIETMENLKIDINCDLGEGIGHEAEILPFIGSCSIACGGHIGDMDTMMETIRGAQRHGVRIGAHPSFADRENFGRRTMHLPGEVLIASIRAQLADFGKALLHCGARLHHIKAHGALYNQTAQDAATAKIYLDALEGYREGALLYVPYGSAVAAAALQSGFNIWYEAFADRNYRADLSLLPRDERDALISDPKKVLAHVLPIIEQGRLWPLNGPYREVHAHTLCVHGDNPAALEILMYLSRELPKHKVLPIK